VTYKAKSEGNGVLEKEAPVSNTIGSVFGWSTGTESEAIVVVVGTEATTVGAVATEVNNGVGSSPITSCVYR